MNDTLKRELEVSVERGAVLLDLKCPGWYDHVTVRKLKMSDCHLCVLGQLYGDEDGLASESGYTIGTETLGIAFSAETYPAQYGFSLPDLVDYGWKFLGKCWAKEIKARKKGWYNMNIGEEDEVITVEPVEDPFPKEQPAPSEPAPEVVPEKEKEVILV